MEMKTMKIKLPLSARCQIAAQGLLLGFTLLIAGAASAQNFVKNPDFEEPLGPDNWTVVYAPVINSLLVNGNGVIAGPCDFLVAGRTTMAHKDMVPGAWDGNYIQTTDNTDCWSKFGGHFAPNHSWVMHAYFKQVVTNLTPLAQYRVSAWMTQFGGHLDAAQAYMEVLGGAGGTTPQKTPYVTENAQNNPAGWKVYAVTNVASSLGKLEIQLHYNKINSVGSASNNYWEYRNQNAYYDHVCVMLASQTNEYLPPYKIVSLVRTNQDIMLQWQTVMNNRYRVQASTNVSDPNSWVMIERQSSTPGTAKLDTNFFATGTTFTFKTNLVSLFSYDPAFDPSAPLFFRIYSTSFKP
jgi:hypothetical protein